MGSCRVLAQSPIHNHSFMVSKLGQSRMRITTRMCMLLEQSLARNPSVFKCALSLSARSNASVLAHLNHCSRANTMSSA